MLIQKSKERANQFSWVVCEELRERAKAIASGFSLSLEDYLLKVYGLSPSKRKKVDEETTLVKSLIAETEEEEGKALLSQALALHLEIMEMQETYQLSVNELELGEKCRRSLEVLTEFYFNFVDKTDSGTATEKGLAIWKEYWFSPGEVSQFVNLIADEEECKSRIWYVCSIYRQTFSTLLGFISREYQNLSSIHISSAGLDFDDMKQLVAARDFWLGDDPEKCVVALYTFLQTKARMFCQNIFTLLYGDLSNRLDRVSGATRSLLEDGMMNRPALQTMPLREFSLLSLEQLCDVITDEGGNAESQNWEHVFSHIFQPLTRDEISRYVLNLGSLRKAFIESKEQTISRTLDLRESVLKAVELTQHCNAAFGELLKNGVFPVTSEARTTLYLSFDGLRDKSILGGIEFSPAILQSMLARLSSGPLRLTDQEFIQEYFSMDYRVFFAYLGLVTSGSGETFGISTRFTIDSPQGSNIHLKKLFPSIRGKAPKIFLCHSTKDDVFVKALTRDLRENGIHVWLAEFEIKVGDSITGRINEALGSMDYLGIVLSPDAVESEWVKKELSAGLMKELEQKSIVVLPVLLRDCQVPPLIQDKKYANFTRTYDRGLEELLERLVQAT
jgi:hypothetical protein